MYTKLSDSEKKTLQRISDLTLTDYQADKDFIPVDNLMVIIEDLLVEYDNLEEKYQDLKEAS